MSHIVTKFFILNGQHYPTGTLLGDDDEALKSGLSHCIEKLPGKEESLLPAPEPAKTIPSGKPDSGIMTAAKLKPKKA